MIETDDSSRKPLVLRVFPDVTAFGIGLVAAYLLKWETRDLVWSLWLGSLVLGYLTILSVIAAGAYFGLHMIGHPDFRDSLRRPAIVSGCAGGLFILVFFSFHFCGFHAGHSVFLRQFFPLEGMPSDGFGQAFMNPPLLWLLVSRNLIRPYGIFLVPALIAERKYVFQSLTKAVTAVRAGVSPYGFLEDLKAGKPGKNQKVIADAMFRPYLNVVRMHLLIFFFALCHFLQLDSFLVFAGVYLVYFFPWSEFRNLQKPDPVRDGA